MTDRRISFLIDGFNLYHSVVEASHLLNNAQTKWLDIRRLCESYLHLLGGQLEDIYYFSALAVHRHPDTIARHQAFLDCLADTGIRIELGRFKEKDVFCKLCNRMFVKHEEKETDVAIAVRLLELFYTDRCDSIAIVSGDTDLTPAIRTAKKLFPSRSVFCVFPFGRKRKELSVVADGTFKMKKESYLHHQFPPVVTLRDGSTRVKPKNW